MTFKGAPLAYAAVGGLMLFSGIKGATWEDTSQAVLTGNLTVTNTEPLSNPDATPVTAGTVMGSASGTAIANDALQYVGHAYVYGGAPGSNGKNPWDCSSFTSY